MSCRFGEFGQHAAGVGRGVRASVCAPWKDTHYVYAVSLTPDGRRAVSGSEDKTLRVWDVESGQCLRTLEGHTDMVLALSLTPDGRRVVSGSRDRTLRVWDVESAQCLRTRKDTRIRSKW